MKTLWIAFVLLLGISACLPEKINKKDPEPELAGTYQITSWVQNGATIIPKAGNSGQINVTKNSDTEISISLTRTINGGTSTTNLGTGEIRKASGTQYDILENGTQVGSIDGTAFVLNVADNTNSTSIAARK